MASSISPLSGIQAASAAFETAANNIPQALTNQMSNLLTAGSTVSDSVSLSAAVAGLLKKNLDFEANVSSELIDNGAKQSSFSIQG